MGFTIYDILKLIEEGRKIIIWDDAGLWLSTYMWFSEETRKYIESFNDYWDVIRTDAYIIFFTTPTKKKLPPRVREDESAILVKITKTSGATRVCRTNNTFKLLYDCKTVKISIAEGAKNIESLYTDEILRETMFRDYFVRYIPEPYYSTYKKMRDSYAEFARQKLKETISKVFPREIYTINTVP